MKAKFIIKTFFLFFCLCAFAPATVAQEKPQALKFDEFDDPSEVQYYWSTMQELSFPQRVERLVKQLIKEPSGTQVYIIYYHARISDESAANRIKSKLYRVQDEITSKTRIKPEEVLEIDGGYREKNTIEFWIAPKNAEPPAPTPTFEKSETYICPNTSVYTEPDFDDVEMISFYVPADNFRGVENYSLTWMVSAGEIVRGQGTNTIKVKINDSAVKRVIAYLEVSGLPFPCPKVFSTTAKVYEKLGQIDEFGTLPIGDVKARMQNFWINLRNNPTAKGYIIIYGGRAGTRGAIAKEKQINDVIRFLRLDASRATVMRGGFRENTSAELWLAFGDVVPVLTPTVDEKFIVAPKPTTKPRSRKK